MDWRNWEGSSMAGSDHILIVGGGIAGLSAAAALRQKGFDPELVEREPKWSALGAGIAIQPNGTRVLQSLGVFAEIEEAGAPLHRFVFCTPQGETLAASISRSCGGMSAAASASNVENSRPAS